MNVTYAREMAKALRDTAEDIMDRADKALAANEITDDEHYKVFDRHYARIMKASTDILLDADLQLSGELEESLKKIDKHTRDLKAGLKNAGRIGDIVTFAALVVGAAVAVASFVVAPAAPAGLAAISALGSAIGALPIGDD